MVGTTSEQWLLEIYVAKRNQVGELLGVDQGTLKNSQPGEVKDGWMNFVKELAEQINKKGRGLVHMRRLESLDYHVSKQNGCINHVVD